MSSDSNPKRIIIEARVTDIDGNPQRRHNALREAFCRQVLDRELHVALHPTIYDHVHIPGDFDPPELKERWFIFDLNVTGTLSMEDVERFPHLVYLACCREGGWEFISRDSWVHEAKRRSMRYAWGGKFEQRIVAGVESL